MSTFKEKAFRDSLQGQTRKKPAKTACRDNFREGMYRQPNGTTAERACRDLNKTTDLAYYKERASRDSLQRQL